MLSRLIEALKTKGLNGRGANAKIAKDTGYSAATVSVTFSDESKLTDKFLRAICTTYGINEEWVKTGKGEVFQQTKTYPMNFAINKEKFLEVLGKISGEGTKEEIKIEMPESYRAVTLTGGLVVASSNLVAPTNKNSHLRK